MDDFGLTEKEEQVKIHKYNHALFKNMMFFADIVLEINVQEGTAVILEDKEDPQKNITKFEYGDFFNEAINKRVVERDRQLFEKHMSLENIRRLEREVSFDIRFYLKKDDWTRYKIVLTPSFSGKVLKCVYLSARNMQAEERHELMEYLGHQFRDAMLPNCYFYYTFDVTGDGLIHEDYITVDGRHMVQEITGMELPISYECFCKKWMEKYQPQFSKSQEKDFFTIDYLKRAYEKNDRMIDIEVKQKVPMNSQGIDYMQMLIILTENPANQHIYASVAWRDISEFHKSEIQYNLELKTANKALRRTLNQEEQFRFASLSGALLVYNINLTRNLIEEEFYEIVDGKRYPMLQLVGLKAPCRFDEFCKKWSETKIPDESRANFLKIYNREYMLDAYRRGERHLEIEYETVIGRGIRIILRNTAFLLEDYESGDILAMVCGKDVSAQREEEFRQRRALREAYDAANNANSAKSDFLAHMSHDLRTPMNAIVGMTAIAQAHLDDSARVADCLKKITISSKYLMGLINEVLDMSKIESGKVSLQQENFALPELIDEMLEIVKPQFKEKNQEFFMPVYEIEHEQVIGDSRHIQQVFMNVMSNAIKYTPPGGSIRLSVIEKSTNKHQVGCYQFIFEDTGIGMSREFIEHIFEPFVRAQDRRVEKIQGTGLGMAIAKNIVQMMNGTIEVESEPDKGSKFTVTIFLKLQDEGMESLDEKFTDIEVLVADDDVTSCEATCRTLAELGIRSEQVQSGQEAVERIIDSHREGKDYFAVMVDWKMFGYDGVGIIKEVRRHLEKNTPIIVVSDCGWSDIEIEAREAGATAFLSEPLFKSQVRNLFKTLKQQTMPLEHRNVAEPMMKSNFKGKRVLLVEDNDMNAEIAEEILKTTNIEVERAVNGKEAVDKVEASAQGYYDIIFMDIQMPVMNGYDAVRTIRALEREDTKRIPILAMSANAFAEDVQAAKACGMNEHIAKPLDIKQLEKSINYWLKMNQ